LANVARATAIWFCVLICTSSGPPLTPVIAKFCVLSCHSSRVVLPLSGKSVTSTVLDTPLMNSPAGTVTVNGTGLPTCTPSMNNSTVWLPLPSRL